VKNISAADHKRVSEAIAAAESHSDGEIVAIATEASDRYHDVALHWAVLALIGVLAWAAALPEWLLAAHEAVTGGWRPAPSMRELLFFVMILAVLAFTLVLLLLRFMPLRLALTPRATKARRVRRRAIELFKAGAERRTVGRTGILIYLSMGEHRAEIVADEAITGVTSPETWAEAMAALLEQAREGRFADGIIAAIELVGGVLAEHFPKSAGNPNEIPDKLIEL
jgi:putative membrane protein